MKLNLVSMVACLALGLTAGCATKTASLGTEAQDHTVTVLATCGGGLDKSTAAKAKAELGHGGELSAEVLSSVRASLIGDGTLKSEDRIKAFDIFTKCALEVDKRIRDGQASGSPVAGLIGRQWYLQEAQYESAVVDQKKHPPQTVELTSKILKSGDVRTQQRDISEALWIRFQGDGRVETNFTMAPHVPGEDPDVLFGEGSAASWTSSNDRDLITVHNGTRYPPTFAAEQAKFEVSVHGTKLVLTRAEGAPNVLIEGTFIAE